MHTIDCITYNLWGLFRNVEYIILIVFYNKEIFCYQHGKKHFKTLERRYEKKKKKRKGFSISIFGINDTKNFDKLIIYGVFCLNLFYNYLFNYLLLLLKKIKDKYNFFLNLEKT